jgi:hypothetical protein
VAVPLALLLLGAIAAAIAFGVWRMKHRGPPEVDVNMISLDTMVSSVASPLYQGLNETFFNEIYQHPDATSNTTRSDIHRANKESWMSV